MIRRTALVIGLTFGIGVAAGCPSSGECPATGSSGGIGPLGGPVVGPVDSHCWGQEAPDASVIFMPQAVEASSCYVTDGGPDTNEDAGPLGPPTSDYGPTLWNVSGGDDDCKYVVGWHSTPISSGAEVTFWVSVQYATDGRPLTGLVGQLNDAGSSKIFLEVAGAPDGGIGNHDSPTVSSVGVNIQESPAGSGLYQIGPAVFFDESGLWYIRFHFNENCFDVLPDSPHGHAAFYVNVP